MNRQEILDSWRVEYNEIKDQLVTIGDKPDGLKYNLLAMEALRLHECILDLVEMDDGRGKNSKTL